MPNTFIPSPRSPFPEFDRVIAFTILGARNVVKRHANEPLFDPKICAQMEFTYRDACKWPIYNPHTPISEDYVIVRISPEDKHLQTLFSYLDRKPNYSFQPLDSQLHARFNLNPLTFQRPHADYVLLEARNRDPQIGKQRTGDALEYLLVIKKSKYQQLAERVLRDLSDFPKSRTYIRMQDSPIYRWALREEPNTPLSTLIDNIIRNAELPWERFKKIAENAASNENPEFGIAGKRSYTAISEEVPGGFAAAVAAERAASQSTSLP